MTTGITGSQRAGRNISRRFRLALPGLPESNAETLTAIIEGETKATMMLEALRGIKAALGQNATFPADVEYARKIAAHAIEKAEEQ